jgi:hypothetical protein
VVRGLSAASAGLAGLSYELSPPWPIDLVFQDSAVVSAGLWPAAGFARAHWN